MANVTLPIEEITDWPSFHAVSAKTFGFPEYYGHNNNAWIDCLGYLTEDFGMSNIVLGSSEILLIDLPAFREFQERCPDVAAGLISCVAAVNAGYIGEGEIPRLALRPQ